MKKARKHPRINIRFENLEQMDLIESKAHQNGMTLQNWIRWLIMRELSLLENRQDSVPQVTTLTLAILEQIVDQKAILRAKEKIGYNREGLNFRLSNS